MQEQKLKLTLRRSCSRYLFQLSITHSNVEFIVDFVSVMPGIPKGEVRSRIILNPQNAKRLLNALSDNIQKFEEKNGKINENSQDLLPIITKSGGMA